MKLASIAMSMLFLLLPPQTAPAGRITGIVIQSGTDRPIDGVEIVATPLAAAIGPLVLAPIGSYTDAAGRFTLEGLAPGRYRMEWNRTGYFTPPVGTAAPDAAIRESLQAQLGVARVFVASPPAAINVTVEVAAGQKIDGFVFTLIPGGVISGQLFNSRGNPLVDKQLTALQVNYEDGFRVLRPGGATTNSDDRGNFRLFGLRPGEYYIRVDDRLGNARAYYPGTGAVADAVPIAVNENGESPGANFKMPDGGTVTIAGTIVSDTGSPVRAPTIYLLPTAEDVIEDPGAFVAFNAVSGNDNRQPGEFELRGVSAGSYILFVSTLDRASGRSLSGRLPISVGAQDIRNVSIEMHSAGILAGRVILEDGSTLRGNLTLRTRDAEAAIGQTPPPFINVKPDGTFLLSPMREAPYSLILNSNDSCIVDILQGGKSAYDDGFTGGSNPQPIDVVVSRQCGSIQVQGPPNLFVALVPAMEHRRNPLLYRRAIFDPVAAKYPALNQIPPGDYKLFVWDKVPPNAELNPAWLAKFEELGIPLKVERDSTQTIQIPGRR